MSCEHRGNGRREALWASLATLLTIAAVAVAPFLIAVVVALVVPS